jgi:geranylgeranyl pyrophosphate synthase
MTGLTAELFEEDEGSALFRRASRAGATEGDVATAVARMETGGARARVEARVAELAGEARASLEAIPLAPVGKAMLAGAVDALCEREL